MHQSIRFVISAAVVATLAACGGGDNTVSNTGSLNGLAATGAAIANGAVTARCVAGPVITGSTNASGVFDLPLTASHTAPCMLQVTGGTPVVTLHSFASAAGRVNISPTTDLVVAKALASDPAAAFAAFDAAKGSTITAALATAKTYVQVQVTAITGLTPSIDPMSGTFVVGDANDKVLDALGTAITAASGKTFADLRSGAIVGANLATIVPKPGQSTGSGAVLGYPATGRFTGKLFDGSACTVDVAADHSVTVSATNWAYSGSVKTTLDGNYFDNTNGEIAPAVFYVGTQRFYESTAGDYSKASSSAPAATTGLSLDASSGKLIMASGMVTTDSSVTPAVGANFNFVCAGEAYPANTPIASSEFNKAAPSRFKATALVGGPYTAPTANSQACTFSVDATGNASINWAGFTTTGGKLDLPYTWLTVDTDQSTTQAKYEIYYNKSTGAVVGSNANGQVILNSGDSAVSDRFSVSMVSSATGKQVTVLANGYASDAKSVTCSTPVVPVDPLVGYKAKAGTYVGQIDSRAGHNFVGAGTTGSCTLTINSDGTTTYRGSNNSNIVVAPATHQLTNTSTDNFSLMNTTDWLSISFNNSFVTYQNTAAHTLESCLGIVKQ